MEVVDIRCFVPAKDYAVSKAFYQALGFSLFELSASLTLCELGECSFFLQDFYDQKLAENLMLQLVVTDIEQAFEQANSFPNETKISGIEHHPWGKVFYLWGPSGELWHICELNNS